MATNGSVAGLNSGGRAHASKVECIIIIMVSLFRQWSVRGVDTVINDNFSKKMYFISILII